MAYEHWFTVAAPEVIDAQGRPVPPEAEEGETPTRLVGICSSQRTCPRGGWPVVAWRDRRLRIWFAGGGQRARRAWSHSHGPADHRRRNGWRSAPRGLDRRGAANFSRPRAAPN